jgi:hypothetical protein
MALSPIALSPTHPERPRCSLRSAPITDRYHSTVVCSAQELVTRARVTGSRELEGSALPNVLAVAVVLDEGRVLMDV